MSRLCLFLALSLPWAAIAGEFDFLKPYEGRWHGSAQTSFGPAALDLKLDLKNPDKPALEAKIKTNTWDFSGQGFLSGSGGSYMLEMPYTRGEGPLHRLKIPITVAARDSGHEMSVRVRESSETFSGALWLADHKNDGAYALKLFLPDGLRIAGIPLPIPSPLEGGTLKAEQYSAIVSIPVFPGVPLELKGSRNAAADVIDASGSFALYFFNGQLHKAAAKKN